MLVHVIILRNVKFKADPRINDPCLYYELKCVSDVN